MFILPGQAGEANAAYTELFNKNKNSEIEISNNSDDKKHSNDDMMRARRHIRRSKYLTSQHRSGVANLNRALVLLQPNS